ncbi:MAG: lysophospholipid acyltransferase family protein [Dermatophilaceae bacterium]
MVLGRAYPAHAQVSGTYRVAIAIAKGSIALTTRGQWRGAERLPTDGGFLVCANHISHADPFAVTRFLWDNGHPPYFLAKEDMFDWPVFGRIMRGAEQIPVRRGSAHAADAYRQAVEAVDAGRCVVVMPESTITTDPLQWPMVGKTGAARIGLATGRPVIPLAQWGAQFVRHRRHRPDRGLRVVSRMLAGPPVPLEDLRRRVVDAPLLRVATDRIMDAITAELETLRGEKAPRGRWDRAAGRRVLRDELGEKA